MKAQSFDPERFDYLNCLDDMPDTESDTKRSASLFKDLEVLQRSKIKSFVTFGNTVTLCENIDFKQTGYISSGFHRPHAEARW